MVKVYKLNKGKAIAAKVKLTDELNRRFNKAKSLLTKAMAIKEETKWRNWLVEQLNGCIKFNKHRRLRHLFRSYPAQKLTNDVP